MMPAPTSAPFRRSSPTTDSGAPRIGDAPSTTPPAGARCLICGYDLAGLDASGVCPECATPIERSLRGNLLRYASPEYIKTLRRGAALVFVAMLLNIFGGLVVGAVGIALSALNVSSHGAIDVLFDIATLAAMLFGWWLLSTPDPAFVGVDDSRNWRARLRWMLPFASIVILANAILPFLSFVLGPTLAGTMNIGTRAVTLSFSARELVETVALLAHGAVVYAGLKYIATLALRFPNPKIRKEAMDAAACMMIILIAILLVFIFGLGGKIFGFLALFALIAGATAGITFVIWLITFLVVIGRLRGELARTLLSMELAAERLTGGVGTSVPPPGRAAHPTGAADSIQPPPMTHSGSDAS